MSNCVLSASILLVIHIYQCAYNVICLLIVVLDQLIETEKNARIEGEKDLAQKILDEAYKLSEDLEREKTERILRVKELNDDTKYELKQQEKMAQDFFQKSKDEFFHIADNIEKEMDNRFEHQDKIVDNLSNMVKTFQDTLKVIGADSQLDSPLTNSTNVANFLVSTTSRSSILFLSYTIFIGLTIIERVVFFKVCNLILIAGLHPSVIYRISDVCRQRQFRVYLHVVLITYYIF